MKKAEADIIMLVAAALVPSAQVDPLMAMVDAVPAEARQRHTCSCTTSRSPVPVARAVPPQLVGFGEWGQVTI